jgi:hypothetical protein
MSTLKHLALSFAGTAVGVFVIFKVAPLRKFLTGLQ